MECRSDQVTSNGLRPPQRSIFFQHHLECLRGARPPRGHIVEILMRADREDHEPPLFEKRDVGGAVSRALTRQLESERPAPVEGPAQKVTPHWVRTQLQQCGSHSVGVPAEIFEVLFGLRRVPDRCRATRSRQIVVDF